MHLLALTGLSFGVSVRFSSPSPWEGGPYLFKCLSTLVGQSFSPGKGRFKIFRPQKRKERKDIFFYHFPLSGQSLKNGKGRNWKLSHLVQESRISWDSILQHPCMSFSLNSVMRYLNSGHWWLRTSMALRGYGPGSRMQSGTVHPDEAQVMAGIRFWTYFKTKWTGSALGWEVENRRL